MWKVKAKMLNQTEPQGNGYELRMPQKWILECLKSESW
jgi:hypothetical protein